MSREPEEKRIVDELTKRMLYKLRINSHKPHWSSEPLTFLLRRLLDEVRELEEACRTGTAEEIAFEAADVANMAAMILDVTSDRPDARNFDPANP